MLSKRTYDSDPATHHPSPFCAAVRGMVRRSLFTAALLTLALHDQSATAAPPTLHDYLRACGIGAADFARLSDDRQMADEELDVVRRIAVRLRDGPADALRQMIAEEPAARLDDSPKNQRGRPLRMRGRVESIEQAAETLWRCVIANETRPHHVVVYVAEAPEACRERPLRRSNATEPEGLRSANTERRGGRSLQGDRVAADAVFVKFVPGVKDQPSPIFVAPRLQPCAAGPLGDLDFDAGLLDGIRDNAPMTAGDSEAFYRLLLLTKTADAGKLRREATVVDAAAAAKLFADPAGQRGRLFRVSGIARRVVKVPIDDPATAARLGADHYFQIDLLADALQDNPLVFCTLELPPAGDCPNFRISENGTVPLAVSTSQPVEVTGFFLKTWQYPTGLTAAERADYPGVSQALQTAPLLVGPPPRWEPASAVKKSYPGWVVGSLLLLAMTGLGLLLWHLRQSDQEFSRYLK